MKPDWSQYPNFREAEFICPCCGEAGIRAELLGPLQQARKAAGIPFRINSGYRCARHNQTVGGVADSAHTLGLAVDIAATDSATIFRLVTALTGAGFRRIGIGQGFVHADVDPAKPAPALWVYR
jgi:zinc D-Ala-D-Ala carboxypeptidase